MPCPKVLAAGTHATPYLHTESSNNNPTYNQAKPLGSHHLPVHWQRLTATSRQPSKHTRWCAPMLSGVRHTPPPCQSRRACELLDHEHLGHDGGDQRQPLGRHVGRPAAAEALATADGRLEGHHAAPVRVHGGGRTSSPVTSDCTAPHSPMPCVVPTPLRPAPAPPEASDVPSQLAIAHSERFVDVLYRCYLDLAYVRAYGVCRTSCECVKLTARPTSS